MCSIPDYFVLFSRPEYFVLFSIDLHILHHSPDSLRSRPEPERYLEIEDGNLPQGLNPLYTAVSSEREQDVVGICINNLL